MIAPAQELVTTDIKNNNKVNALKCTFDRSKSKSYQKVLVRLVLKSAATMASMRLLVKNAATRLNAATTTRYDKFESSMI